MIQPIFENKLAKHPRSFLITPLDLKRRVKHFLLSSPGITVRVYRGFRKFTYINTTTSSNINLLALLIFQFPEHYSGCYLVDCNYM